MEQNFQTSFIPKKPMLEERAVSARPVGLLLILSIFILFTMLIGSGGLYFYRGVMQKDIVQMKDDLSKARNRFEPSKITQLQVLDKRLQASTEILDKHVAISPIFQALQDATMKTVRFTNFNYSFGEEKNSKILVKMSGVAIGYKSIALQSDLFAQNEYFIDPVFSNLSLDNSGNVIFDLNFAVEPTFVNYKDKLKKEKEDAINKIVPVISN